MASIIFTAKDIFDQDFKREVRGYNKDEVNEFLDDVIKDYETYAALVKELREENARLREELAQKHRKHHKHLRLLALLRKNSRK